MKDAYPFDQEPGSTDHASPPTWVEDVTWQDAMDRLRVGLAMILARALGHRLDEVVIEDE